MPTQRKLVIIVAVVVVTALAAACSPVTMDAKTIAAEFQFRLAANQHLFAVLQRQLYAANQLQPRVVARFKRTTVAAVRLVTMQAVAEAQAVAAVQSAHLVVQIAATPLTLVRSTSKANRLRTHRL